MTIEVSSMVLGGIIGIIPTAILAVYRFNVLYNRFGDKFKELEDKHFDLTKKNMDLQTEVSKLLVDKHELKQLLERAPKWYMREFTEEELKGLQRDPEEYKREFLNVWTSDTKRPFDPSTMREDADDTYENRNKQSYSRNNVTPSKFDGRRIMGDIADVALTMAAVDAVGDVVETVMDVGDTDPMQTTSQAMSEYLTSPLSEGSDAVSVQATSLERSTEDTVENIVPETTDTILSSVVEEEPSLLEEVGDILSSFGEGIADALGD